VLWVYFMLQEGALDDVSAIFGLHGDPMLPVGVVSSGSGPFAATSAQFFVTITGKGVKSYQAIDPIIIFR
jgi:IAA-amino acid hydrolase